MRITKNIRLTISSTLLITSTFCVSSAVLAEGSSDNLWDKFTNNVSKTWASDQYELYIPAITWHNRFTYDKSKTDEYNERPWGIGFGKYRFDEDNDWHALYAMAFKDSHNKFEPIIGYGFQKMWIPGELDGFRMGAGFTLSVTARDDYSYVPIPLPLPLVSVEYDRLSLQATYIPGTYNNGNVLFAWLRWQW